MLLLAAICMVVQTVLQGKTFSVLQLCVGRPSEELKSDLTWAAGQVMVLQKLMR